MTLAPVAAGKNIRSAAAVKPWGGKTMIWDMERGEIEERLAQVAKQLEEMRAYL
jgi:hypothetical protein